MRERKTVTYMIALGMLLAFFTAAPRAAAQQREIERDPFFPSEQRPAAAAPTPEGNAWGRDPFTNPFGAKTLPGRQDQGVDKPQRSLTGIIYSKTQRLAIIGDEVLREGSRVGEKKIVDIRRKSVVLMDGSGRYEELTLEDFSLGK